MLPRPRYRMPLWAPFAVVAVVYVVRAAERGFDFRPDMPLDAVLLALLVVAVGLVAWTRSDDARRDAEDERERRDSEDRDDG